MRLNNYVALSSVHCKILAFIYIPLFHHLGSDSSAVISFAEMFLVGTYVLSNSRYYFIFYLPPAPVNFPSFIFKLVARYLITCCLIVAYYGCL